MSLPSSGTPDLFAHVHARGARADAPPLVLLHGTGGNEHDLMAFGRAIAPDSDLLGIRGRASEGPVTRWFRRFGEGRFDLEDMAAKAAELAAFLADMRLRLGWTRAPVAVGYSNGANMAGGGLLMRHPEALSGAILMRTMAGLEPRAGLDLAGRKVLLLSGADDPLAPAASRARLAGALADAGAEVREEITGPGHGLVPADADAARRFLAGLG
jgi:phospholipase/carboxylesterase